MTNDQIRKRIFWRNFWANATVPGLFVLVAIGIMLLCVYGSWLDSWATKNAGQSAIGAAIGLWLAGFFLIRRKMY